MTDTGARKAQLASWLLGHALGVLVGAAGLAILSTLASPSQAQPAGTQGPFQSSDRCTACHNSLVTAAGEDASVSFDWRSSMMANAARDPYWQASVRREVTDHPRDRHAIEDKCSTCHMGMARTVSKAAGQPGTVLDQLPSARPAATPRAQLAADGVSCTLCHQIQPQNLGRPESQSGGFLVAPWRAVGERAVFGPFEIDRGRRRAMSSGTSAFAPTQGTHLASSELCASCHTLYTHPHDAAGKPLGELPEQVPYLEWRHSSYAPLTGCTSCHMPEVATPMSATAVLPKARPKLSRHVFQGGNFFMPRMLNRNRSPQGVVALGSELEATAARALEHLANETARLELGELRRGSDTLELAVTVHNLAGHKLPTAYPSRRAWLELAVRDAAGAVVFTSGTLGRNGRIAGNDNDDDPTRFEPHHPLVDEPGKVPIFESVMVDEHGVVTTGLMSGVRYVKDNRILPRGFDKATATADVAVHGDAAHDDGFRAGAATVRYRIAVAAAEAPLRVTVTLRYQPIGFRWARNLAATKSLETNRFVSYFDAQSSGSAAVLAHAERLVP